MEEKDIKDKELVEIKNERYEARTKLEEARLEAIRTVEIVAKERERKRQQVLSSLQKFDQTTDPEAYLSSFELFMREGVIPEGEWTPRRRVASHSPKASFTKRLCEESVSGSIDTPLFSQGVPRTTREGHSDCGSAGSRIRGQLGIQTLHSKDPNAARQDHHWKNVDEATTGAPHHYGDRWIGFGSKVVAGGNPW